MNPFYFQKFGMEQILLRRNGLPIASTPISTQDHKVSSSTHYQHWVGCAAEWESLWITTKSTFFICFDLTSTQQEAQDFLHPEITNCSISLDLQLSNALTAILEIFVWDICSANVFITADHKVKKNVLPFFTV